MTLITWDYKDAPPVEELNAAIAKTATPHLFLCIDSDDSWAIVVGSRWRRQEEAQRFYEEEKSK